MILEAAGLVALAGAGALCRLRARADRCGDMLSAARTAEALLAADLGRLAISSLVLGPARAAGRTPFAGWERAAFHASQALFLGRPFAIAALCWALFSNRGKHAACALAGLWIGCSILVAVSYPELRGDALASCYRWHQLMFGIAVGLASILDDRPDPWRFRAGRAHLVALLLVAGLAAELAGPYLGDAFASWWTAQVSWIPILLGVALAAAWGRTWRIRPA